MAVSFNSVVGFSSTKLRSEYQNVSKSSAAAASLSRVVCQGKPCVGAFWSRRVVKERRRDFYVSVAEGDQLTAEGSDGGPGNAERILSNDLISSGNLGAPEASNTSTAASVNQEETSSAASQLEKPKRSPLTARERLRAARVLNRYNNTESKASKSSSSMSSKVLDAIRESDRGKKKGLPEAPGNMLDDSKRGMPPKGLTFQFPGGNDLFVIIFSFVFISTVMFATTFIVWKVGAIHFNEY
ncbi:uncharacterized protein LOC133798250 isoform X1 [Humulus lupulus]|uniref:uncharacterized protein LOC133798250 isoform X1 n=1 Tax=Humulus lupulus TaxID=3486 RepID=UPI002B4035FC|nr:uncharacterized protein LOC133798250 isoform X1 [Humulus lupulus]